MANSATTIIPMIGVAPHPLHSALEGLLYPIFAHHPRDETYAVYINPHTDSQILTQWILCQYLRGMTPQLSEVHYKVRETILSISAWIDRILEGKEPVRIRDRYLRDFLQKSFKAKIDDLVGISSRLRVDQVIPISIVYLVVAMYTDQRYQMQDVTLFSLKVNENELMPIVLHPLREVNISLQQSLSQNGHDGVLWQLILGIEYFRSAEITLSEKIRLLGELAVPLCAQYNWNSRLASNRMITIQEVPVTNYCATLFKEIYMLGWSDNLMSYAVNRRTTTFQTLKQQLSYDIHDSIGCCRQKIAGNPSIVTAFFKTLLLHSDTVELQTTDPLRLFLSNMFSRADVGEATEASKPKAKADDNIEDTTSDPKDVSFRKSPQTEHQTEHPSDQTEAPVAPTKPDAAEPADDVPKFDDGGGDTGGDSTSTDSDQTGDDTQNPEDTVSNNIESSDPLPTKPKVGKLITLASPDETLDDFLWKRSVQTFASSLIENPDTDISPDAIDTLQKWCSQWLFLASVKKTKELLAQLKITSLMEFK